MDNINNDVFDTDAIKHQLKALRKVVKDNVSKDANKKVDEDAASYIRNRITLVNRNILAKINSSRLVNNYKHREAFCLMLYFCEDCHTYEYIWNSRDGVTPFIITCQKCNKYAKHEMWNDDLYLPNLYPMGLRWFSNITLIQHTNNILKLYNHYKDHPNHSMTEEIRDNLIKEFNEELGKPYIMNLEEVKEYVTNNKLHL